MAEKPLFGSGSASGDRQEKPFWQSLDFVTGVGIPSLAVLASVIFPLEKMVRERKVKKKEEQAAKDEVFKVLKAKDLRTTIFDDVVGHERVKSKFLAWARRIRQADESSQKYLLLTGPPGTGKSMMVRAFASAISDDTTLVNVNCETLIKNPESILLLEKELQSLQKKQKPIVLLMDELSSVGNRQTGDADKINHLLRIMDGVTGLKGKVAIVGTTNYPEQLDDAFRNRFQQILPVPAPTQEERAQILASYLKRFNLTPDETVDLNQAAQHTEGMTGRKLEHAMEVLKEQLEEDRETLLMNTSKAEHEEILDKPLIFSEDQLFQAIRDTQDWVKDKIDVTV
jgi:AAA+ superfamily predicted ATPase